MTVATITEFPVAATGPVKDFLLQLLDDAAGFRLPDGTCMDCARSPQSRCRQHAEDDAQAQRYTSLLAEVDEAASDIGSLGVFLRAVLETRP